MSIAVCNLPIEQVVVIAPENVNPAVSGHCLLPPHVKARCFNCVHDQVIAESAWVLLIAPELDFLIQVTRQIRNCPQTALVPLIAATGPNYINQELEQLVDASFPLPINNQPIYPTLDKLGQLVQKLQQFSPMSVKLAEREGRWLNLLRFMYSREIAQLVPQWNIHAKEGYSYPLAGNMLGIVDDELPQLELLAQMGLLEGKFHDKIHLCPQCGHYQLNFREVCPTCRNSQLYWEEYLHHFMCGIIAPRREFSQAGGLVCPKCRQELLHPGVDYDKPSAGYYCPACRKPFAEPVVDCRCLNCGNLSPSDKVQAKTIQQFHLSALGIQAAQSGQLSQDKLKELLYRKLGILDYDLFKRLFEIEINLARRYPRDLSLVKLEINNYKVTDGADLSNYHFWGNLMGSIRNNLRINDLVTWLGGDKLLVLSLGANVNKVKQAFNRMQKTMARDWPGIDLQPSFISVNPSQNWELLLQEVGGGENFEPQRRGEFVDAG